MRKLHFSILFIIFFALLPIPFVLRVSMQSSVIRFRELNPVVNEGKQIMLTAVDASGQAVKDVIFESGSPDIASVDRQTGMVSGVRRGFATITARKGSETVSTFVVVARIESNKGARVPGDTKSDTGGRIYISDPVNNVILRKDGFAAAVNVYAGQRGKKGNQDGQLLEALFAGPTAVAVDNSATGGLYIADTLNHSIRKIDFNNQVTKVLGKGVGGMNSKAEISFDEAMLNAPRGVALDTGGNLIIADTDNHAIYHADMTNKMLRLLAGQPGVRGRTDGTGSSAQFSNPSGIAVSNDGRNIAVADTGNNSVRLITRDGTVSTIGRASSSNIVELSDQQADLFNGPKSVSFDGTGNLYVVDESDESNKSGVFVVTLASKTPQIVPLAQPGTFGKAGSVVVGGTQVLVLDTNSQSEDEAVKVVTVGAPEIISLSRDGDRLEGGAELIVTGKNFAPESLVVLGDSVVFDFTIVSATEIRLIVPPQDAPGTRTLSIQTRGGVAQREFNIRAKTLSELVDGQITTVAGGIPFLGDGGMATKASLNGPASITIDSAGNLFIADFDNHRVRRVDTSGVITTVAGNGRRGFSGDGGLAISASLDSPTGLAIDGDGNLFFVDRQNFRIRRVDAKTGIITTFAGDGSNGLTGDDGPATMAGMGPIDIAIDSSGNLFIADSTHSRIRRIDAKTGIITTVAGSGPEFTGSFGGDGGPANRARLNSPFGVVVDEADNLFIADGLNNRIRRVDAKTGIITTVAGDGFKGDFGQGRFKGDGGPAIEASLSIPTGLALDSKGNLYIADIFNLRVRQVDTSGKISTVAGNGSFDFSGDGGPATVASLINPQDIVADGAGNLFIADFGNDRIRRVDTVTQIISTIAGIGENTFRGDGGLAVNARLRIPRSVSFDRTGNLLIVDQLNNRIRRVDKQTGNIITIAGGGKNFIGDEGPATDAILTNPLSVAADELNNLFIADRDSHRIRRVDSGTGIITTVVGGDRAGLSGDGGPATKAGLDSPVSVAFDRAGNLYIADSNNHRIRRVDRSTGIITTFVGTGPPGGFDTGGFGGDGGPAKDARLNIPSDVALDISDNLFILDLINFRIRRVEGRTGIITTVAGGGDDFSDGIPAISARLDFFSSGGLAVDKAGNLFISDQGNHRIRRVDARTGIITTVAGSGTIGFSGDGGPALQARLSFPDGLAVDEAGNLYIADMENNVVRVVKGIAAKEGGQRTVTISNASFNKPNFVINGSGFGSSGAAVSVNGRDISARIVTQSDTSITLKGNKKKINLKNGSNQITVTVAGVTSNTFVLNLATEE
jgi:sugar lactone lactonase YvrE